MIRVAVEHAHEITSGSADTLHYYILARGTGHRYARFLRLWSAPPLETPNMSEEIDTTLAVARFAPVLNVLEMTFCRAFQSLPGCVLTDFFGPGDYSDVGLNNLPPSFEGRNVPAHLRTKNTGYHRQSPDVDIASSLMRERSNCLTSETPCAALRVY